MSHLDEWAHLIARQLKSEAELVGAQARSDLYEDAARETFIRVVLEPFLPSSYAVGSGRVIDASGNISSVQDIVIFRRDYPQFNMPGSHNVFIYESVLATIQVSSKLVLKSFFNALDKCASLGTLNPVIDATTLRGMASKMKMRLDAQRQYVHTDPLITGRFDLIGRPQSFIYAFSGYQTSEKQLVENLVKWINHYHEHHDALQMRSLPSVIATQGCFAWRNTAPFPIKGRALMCVGIDHAPLRLMILQLMQALNRRLQNTSDGYGIKSNIAPYLAQFEPPAISEMVGTACNPADTNAAPAGEKGNEHVAANSQAPAARQEPPSVDKHENVKSARVARLEASAKRAATLGTAGSATDEPRRASVAQLKQPKSTTPASTNTANSAPENGEHSSTKQSAKVTNRSAQQPARRVPEETAGKGPVIENLSKPWPQRARTESSQPSVGDDRTGPSSGPLSLFSDGDEGDVEEYQFCPVEFPRPQPVEEDSQQESEADDDGFLSTQEIKSINGHIDTGTESRKTTQAPGPAAPQQDEEVDSSFLDTLVETAESLAEDKSEPSKRKAEYVTESLI